MPDKIDGPQPTRHDVQRRIQAAEISRQEQLLEVIQNDNEGNGLDQFFDPGFNMGRMSKGFSTLNERSPADISEQAAAGEEKEEVADRTKELAQQFAKKHPEHASQTLVYLKSYVKPEDDINSLLTKVRRSYPDPSLADEALDFLIESAAGGKNEELGSKLRAAKEKFNTEHGRDIRSGRNIAEQARQFSQEGLGSPTGLRDLYRGIVANPVTNAYARYEELNKKFNFEKMKTAIDFILHSLGSDLKAKGPSISREELQTLFTEGKIMQAILGVYRFFEGRMKLIQGEFDRSELVMPARINFENLAKVFMQFIQERYPSADKVLKLATQLGIPKELLAQLIVFTQYRDAMRNTAPRLFQSEKHWQGLLMTFIEALSNLEEAIEEEDDEERPKKQPFEEDVLE